MMAVVYSTFFRKERVKISAKIRGVECERAHSQRGIT